MKRRTFILSLVGGSALGWTGWKNDSSWSHRKLGSPDLAKVTRSTQALGTHVSLTLFHTNARLAENAIQEAFEELELIEQLMSIYRKDSQLSQLNRNGLLSDPHPYLLEVLKTAESVSQLTKGAFDVTIQPLYELFANGGKQRPASTAIKQALDRIDWKQVLMSEERIALQRSGSAITLNGIAQGFASDVIAKVLVSHGVTNALIDSGEIGTLGGHSEDRAWSIGIKHPRHPGEILGLTSLESRSLATSGDYETRFSDGFDLHHLLDPRTGTPANELSSVSVAAPSATMADALSTAVFILGLQEGKKLIEKTKDADALFVTKEGEIFKTKNFPLLT